MNPAKELPQYKSITAKELLGAAFLLACALAVVFFDSLSGQVRLFIKTMADPTPLFLFLPAEHAIREALLQGHLPLWDPSRGLGTPQVMPSGGTILYLLKLPLYFLGDEWQNWGRELLLILRIWTAGLAAYLAARVFRIPPIGAFVAAIEIGRASCRERV